jgi:hypothetical protein
MTSMCGSPSASNNMARVLRNRRSPGLVLRGARGHRRDPPPRRVPRRRLRGRAEHGSRLGWPAPGARTYRQGGWPERMLRCLDLGTMASEDLCGEGRHSSGRLPEAS